MSQDNQGKSQDQLDFSTVAAYTCFAVMMILLVGAYIHACSQVAR